MFRLHTLGRLELLDSDGNAVGSVLAQPKRVALLVYLAAAPLGRFHRRDTLVALFWPESDQTHARDSLRQAIRYLRRSLGTAVLGRGDEELGIDPSRLHCDAAAFEEAMGSEQLEAALEMYEGDFLPGFFISDVPRFEEWLEGTRRRLRRQALQAAWTLAESLEGRGDQVGASRYAHLALRLGPDDEATLRRLMGVFARIGDRASAVRAYEAFAARLEEDLGIEPSEETRRLVERVRAGEVRPPPEARAAAPEAGHGENGPSPEPLIEPRPPEREGEVRHTAAPAPTRERSLFWPPGLLAAVAVMILLTAAGVVRRQNARHAHTAGERLRVTVGSFVNRTGRDSLARLGGWAVDGVFSGLSRMSETESVEVLRGGSDAEGAEGVTVSGAYYLFGDSIQFQVRITDADGSAMIPAVDPVSGGLDDARAVVHTLGERVTGAVAAHRDPWVRALAPQGCPPPSWESYLAWVEGLKRYGRADYRASLKPLLHAASLDSSFVTPLIWAAAAYGNLGEDAAADSLLRIADRRRNAMLPFDRDLLDMWQAQLRGEVMKQYEATRSMLDVAGDNELTLFLAGSLARAVNHPHEAVGLLRRIDATASPADWDDYDTRLTYAYHMLGEYDAELEEAKAVIERSQGFLRPRRDEIRALAALGRSGEALDRLDRVFLMQPEPTVSPADVARETADELRAHGDTAAAMEALRRAEAWYEHRTAEEKRSFGDRYGLAAVRYGMGLWKEAGTRFLQLSDERPGCVECLGYVGTAAAHRGDVLEAAKISKELKAMDGPYLRGANTLWRARIAALAGDVHEGMNLLRQALAEGRSYGLWLHTDVDLSPLRQDPSFQNLLQPRG